MTDRAASYEGKSVNVATSRLRLLHVLVEADGALTAKELTVAAFDRDTEEANTRYHLRELKRELTATFDFEGEIIRGDGDGYRLVLR